MTRLNHTHVMLSLLLTVLLIQPAWAQNFSKTKLEKEVEKMAGEIAKEKPSEEAKELEDTRQQKEQIEQLLKQQQFVQETNQRLQMAIARARFATAIVLLDKDTFVVGEKIRPEYVLKNKSRKKFWIDGRKLRPQFVVKDDKGNVVLTVGKKGKNAPPKKKDMISLKPGETFTPQNIKTFSLSDPGEYTLFGTYTFLKPKMKEKEEEENLEIWVGTANTYIRRFQIVAKE